MHCITHLGHMSVNYLKKIFAGYACAICNVGKYNVQKFGVRRIKVSNHSSFSICISIIYKTIKIQNFLKS